MLFSSREVGRCVGALGNETRAVGLYICAGSIPSSVTSLRANIVSFLFLSIRRSVSL